MNLNLSTLLDVTLSLVFVYFVLSLFVSGIVEFINTMIDKRSNLLRLALEKLLEKDLFTDFWEHKLVKIKEQTLNGAMKPISYLSADSFSTVIIDLLTRNKALPHPAVNPALNTDITLEIIRAAVITDKRLSPLKPILDPMLARADTLSEFKQCLDRWYDGYMEQVSGWFKRYSQGVIWFVSGMMTLIFNINTITITKQIFNDKTLKASLVAQAEKMASSGTLTFLAEQTGHADTTRPATLKTEEKNSKGATQTKVQLASTFNDFLQNRDSVLAQRVATGKAISNLDSLKIKENYLAFLQENLDGLGLPIGWSFPPSNNLGQNLVLIGATALSWSLLGWLLTTAALSFGAPFWFDLLLKIVNIRNVAKKPISSVLTEK